MGKLVGDKIVDVNVGIAFGIIRVKVVCLGRKDQTVSVRRKAQLQVSGVIARIAGWAGTHHLDLTGNPIENKNIARNAAESVSRRNQVGCKADKGHAAPIMGNNRIEALVFRRATPDAWAGMDQGPGLQVFQIDLVWNMNAGTSEEARFTAESDPIAVRRY